MALLLLLLLTLGQAGMAALKNPFTKLDDPAELPAGTGTSAAFSHDSTYLVVALLNSPYVTIYKNTAALPTWTNITMSPARLFTDKNGLDLRFGGSLEIFIEV